MCTYSEFFSHCCIKISYVSIGSRYSMRQYNVAPLGILVLEGLGACGGYTRRI